MTCSRPVVLAILGAVAASGAATSAAPPALDARVESAVSKLSPQMVEIRHRIHQNPEVGTIG